LLQGTEAPLACLLEFPDVEAKLTGIGGGQATQAFAEKHCGASLIIPLKMVMGYGNLENALEYRPEASLGFMPDRFKIIVTSVPLAPIEGGHAGVEARILEDQHFLGRGGIGAAQRFSVWQVCGLATCVNESIRG
jgi:hypothetical protein